MKSLPEVACVIRPSRKFATRFPGAAGCGTPLENEAEINTDADRIIMNSQKAFTSFVLMFLVIVFGACRKRPPVTSTPAPNSSAPTTTATDLHHPTELAQTKFFKGSIGNSSDLQMKLIRDGQSLKGSYFYQKVGTRIDLKGAVDPQNNVTLEEYDPAGKQTGLFKGVWKVDNADGSISI